MRRITVLLLALFVLCAAFTVSAFAGGRVFIGIGRGRHFIPRVGSFFHHRRSRSHFFFQFGHHQFGHHGIPGRWGYFIPPTVGVPYSGTPQEVPQAGFSGTGASGALYVDGYRILPSGWLRVQVEPADATVLIDGFPSAVDRNRGASASMGLPVGSHLVEAYKEGFQKYQSEVEVKQATETNLVLRLGR